MQIQAMSFELSAFTDRQHLLISAHSKAVKYLAVVVSISFKCFSGGNTEYVFGSDVN